MQWYSPTGSRLLLRSVWGQVRPQHLNDAGVLEKWELQLGFAGAEARRLPRRPVLRVQPLLGGCGSCREFPALCIYGWRPALHYKEVSEKLLFLLLFSSFSHLQYERHSIDLCDLRVILKNYKSKSSAIFPAHPHEHTGLFSTVYPKCYVQPGLNNTKYTYEFVSFGKGFETRFPCKSTGWYFLMIFARTWQNSGKKKIKVN